MLIRLSFTLAAVGVSLTMSLVEFGARQKRLIHAAIITGAMLDIIIAVSLSYYLYKRSRNCMTRLVILILHRPVIVEGWLFRTQWIARRLIRFSIGECEWDCHATFS
jgi:hypothetical protein